MKNNDTKVITMTCSEGKQFMFAMVLYSLESDIVKVDRNNNVIDKLMIDKYALKEFYRYTKTLVYETEKLNKSTYKLIMFPIYKRLLYKMQKFYDAKIVSGTKMKIEELEAIISVFTVCEKLLFCDNSCQNTRKIKIDKSLLYLNSFN
jgi:hypothetical protein